MTELNPPEARAAWVAALRSGKYVQAQEYLHPVDGGFCCLGVACEVFIAHGGKLSMSTMVEMRYHSKVRRYDGQSQMLPAKVAEWLDLGSLDGALAGADSLVVQNDEGCSFEEIADVIEREWGVA